MKRVLITTFIILISGASFASDSCKVDNKNFYLVGQKGVKDWDNKQNKLVENFPRTKILTSDYQEKMNMFAKVKGKCPELGKFQIDIYRLIGKRSFTGESNNKHEKHGTINQGEWDKKSYITLEENVSIKNGELKLSNIPIRKLLEEDVGDNEHVWQLKFVFKGHLNPSPAVIIVESPLIH